MNKGIAHVLKEWIDLPMLSKRAGLVYTQVKAQPVQLPDGGVRSTLKRFPVSCDVTLADGAECDAGNLIDLVPNSNQSGMLYFEDLGTNNITTDRTINYESKLRLVVWYNTRNVVPVDEEATISCWEYSSLLIQQILSIFRSKAAKNVGIYQRIFVSVDRIIPVDATVFSKYTYEEEKIQYLMHPYDYFALDLTVKFSVNSICTLEIKKGEVVC